MSNFETTIGFIPLSNALVANVCLIACTFLCGISSLFYILLNAYKKVPVSVKYPSCRGNTRFSFVL